MIYPLQEPCEWLRDVLTDLLPMSDLDPLKRVIELEESLLLRRDRDVPPLSAHPEDGVLKEIVVGLQKLLKQRKVLCHELVRNLRVIDEIPRGRHDRDSQFLLGTVEEELQEFDKLGLRREQLR